MEARICGLIMLMLQMLSLVSATSRPLAANDGDVGVNHPGSGPLPTEVSLPSNIGSHFSSIQGPEKSQNEATSKEAAHLRGLMGIGSSPPSCEHKCYGCSPCEAIQVPTSTKKTKKARVQAVLRINYANYEPERWKCKCGPVFYSP